MRRAPKPRLPARKLLPRRAPVAKAPAAAAANVLGTVESTVLGVLLFVRRFLVTCALAAVQPGRLGRALSSDGVKEKARLLGPFTFLCLAGFYSVKLLRIALIFLLLLPLTILKGCEAETTEELRWPAMAEILLPPAADELVLIGLPLVAVCLGLSWLVWKFLEGRNESQRQAFIQAACYAFGLEFLLLLPFCALMGAWAFALGGDSPEWFKHALDADFANFAVLAVIFAAVVFWPALSLYKMLAAARSAGRFAIAFAALAACAAMLLVGFAMSYPSARAEFIGKYRPKPVLGMAPVGQPVVAPAARVTVAVWNRSDLALQFDLGRAKVFDANGDVFRATIAGKPNAAAPLFQLQPREKTWLALDVGEPIKSSIRPYYGSRTPRVCLTPLAGSAPHDIVCAWVGPAPSKACDWEQSWVECVSRWVWAK
jgi:hypothetical protein